MNFNRWFYDLIKESCAFKIILIFKRPSNKKDKPVDWLWNSRGPAIFRLRLITIRHQRNRWAVPRTTCTAVSRIGHFDFYLEICIFEQIHLIGFRFVRPAIVSAYVRLSMPGNDRFGAQVRRTHSLTRTGNVRRAVPAIEKTAQTLPPTVLRNVLLFYITFSFFYFVRSSLSAAKLPVWEHSRPWPVVFFTFDPSRNDDHPITIIR